MLLDQTQEWRQRDDFAVFTVSLDRDSTIAGAHKLIRQHHVDYPVLWFGPTDNAWGTCDWNVKGVPTAYLIDPQGNIVLDLYPDEHLNEVLKYYIDQRGIQPPIAMSMTGVKNPDGSLKFDLSVTNPTHEPQDVMIDISRNVLEYWDTIDGKFQRVDNPPPGAEPNMNNITTLEEYSGSRKLEFDEFGMASLSITVPAVEPCWMVCYSAEIILPGSEQMLGGQGIMVRAGGCLQMEEQK